MSADNNLYPWQQVSEDIIGLDPADEEKRLVIATSICTGLASGKLTGTDKSGLPVAPPQNTKDFQPIHVSPNNVNKWLSSCGFQLTWDPLNPQIMSTKSVQNTAKRWTDPLIEVVNKRKQELKAAGVRNFSAQAAKEFGVDPSRVNQITRKKRASSRRKVNLEAFSSVSPKKSR